MTPRERERTSEDGSAADTTRTHTVILSDLHLTEEEPLDPQRPLWKRYKQRAQFIDDSFARWLDAMCQQVTEAGSSPADVELVLAGDIFDFDAVTAVPSDPPWPVSWLERRRGLDPEEDKSRFKIEVILRDHPVWVDAVQRFIHAGGRVVFLMGNHDIELQWPAVQQELLRAFDLREARSDAIRFAEWFYVTGETLIEHGNQYDAYSMCNDPILPFIDRGDVRRLRLPFGNIAGRLMLNGMGLFNPHVESSFIMSFREYVVFFLKYMTRVQPLLVWAWLWSAMATLVRALSDGLHPTARDPVRFAERVDDIAERANSTSSTTLALQQLHAHPAIFNPFKILRELWLDRALLMLALFYVSFQLVLLVNAFVPVSFMWTLAALALLSPAVLFYARSVQTDVYDAQKASLGKIALAAQLTGTRRVVHGHTHRELHTVIDGVEHLNAGSWSPGYRDAECTKPFGRKCFIWLEPTEGGARTARLYAWRDPSFELLTGREDIGVVRWKHQPGTSVAPSFAPPQPLA